MDRASPTPHHRHQSSLEGIISFNTEPVFGADERPRAQQKFYRILDHFEAVDSRADSSYRKYNRPRLVRFTYEYARSEKSQDMFLRAFLWSMALSVDDETDLDLENNEDALGSDLSRFADYLFDNFFFPCKTEEPPVLFFRIFY